MSKEKFYTDRQTAGDLNLLGRFRKDSIINIFDRTRTRCGRQRLEAMFRSPLTVASEINARAELVGWFRGCGAEMFLTEEDVEAVEFYMGFRPSSGKAGALADMLLCRARQIVLGVPSWQKVLDGIAAVSSVIVRTDRLLSSLPTEGCPVTEEIGEFRKAFPEAFVRELETVGSGELSFKKAVSLDRRLRVGKRAQIGGMMELLYDMDVWISVSSVAAARGFCTAEAVDSKDSFIEIENVYHPVLKSAVPNDIRMDSRSNVFFLTGVNMAGKSTLMKSVAIALYLAQMGFPVPATAMRFTPMDGLVTSINVSDNISLGYSHFYAEVLRVKGIAEKVGEGKRLFIVFDELFKGTNVKDAYDATLAVTQAFAKHTGCLYIISTHIVEVASALEESCGNVRFRCLPSEMEDGRLVYHYKLHNGISSDRHGMTIIRNEHILDILKGSDVPVGDCERL